MKITRAQQVTLLHRLGWPVGGAGLEFTMDDQVERLFNELVSAETLEAYETELKQRELERIVHELDQ